MNTDDNREEDLQEEDVSAEGEEDTSSDAEDEEEGEEGDEGSDDDEEESEEGSDDDEGDDGEGEGDDEDDEGDDDDEDDPSGKFKGKSRKDILKSYRNLEQTVGERALKLAQDMLLKQGIKPPEDKEKKDGEDEDTFDLGLTDEEIAKMKPSEFARHLNRKILEGATKIAREAINSANESRQKVRTEIQAATKAHPHLKTNSGYRDVVVSLIEAAAAKGETLSLKEACKRADKAMNIKPGQAPADDGGKKDGKKKRPRTDMERPDGNEAGKKKTEEDRVRDSLGSTGASTGALGGLF
jgi:hypothetical protein